MSQRPSEELTPLEGMLVELPEEEAPDDLPERCLATLDAVPAAAPRPVLDLGAWRPLAAAACVLIMFVGVTVMLTTHGARYKTASEPPGLTRHYAEGPASPPTPAPGAPGMPGPVSPGGPGGAPGGMAAGAPPTATPPPGAEAGPQAAPPRGGPGPQAKMGWANSQPMNWSTAESRKKDYARALAQGGTSNHQTALDNMAAGHPEGNAAPAPDRESVRYERERRANQLAQAPPVTTSRSYHGDQATPPATQPWYDTSPERKKITSRIMELRTPDVEGAHKEAVSIIEGAEGYVLEENLQLEDRGPDFARLTARVPVGKFEDVMGRLRALGKVVRLTGSSQDRTQEYRQRGDDVRTLNEREADLVRKLEQERDQDRKAALQRQLARLRAERSGEKRNLLALAAETDYAYLDLTITQQRGVWYILTKASLEALPLAMGLALMLVPLLVLALLLKKRS